MNENGQFLLYDAIFALIILFIVSIAVLQVINEETLITDYTDVQDDMNLLSDIQIEGKTLLSTIDNNTESQEIIKEVLKEKDFTIKKNNQTILEQKSHDYKNIISSNRNIDGESYELIEYF